LGEYAALVVAGVLSESDAIFVVGTRAVLLDSLCTSHTHGMLSVRTSMANALEAADGLSVEVACIKGPNDIVLGGPHADLEATSRAMADAGHHSFKLPLAHA
jgi:acyl transferase domain-containing protein